MAGLKKSSQSTYLSQWRQWVRFRLCRKGNHCVASTRPGWVELPTGYIVRFRFFIKYKASGITPHLGAIRYMRVIARYPEYTSHWGRCETLIRPSRLGVPRILKFPPNLDSIRPIRKLYGDLRSSDLGIKIIRIDTVRSAFLLMRVGDTWGIMTSRYTPPRGRVGMVLYDSHYDIRDCPKRAWSVPNAPRGGWYRYPFGNLTIFGREFQLVPSVGVFFIRKRYYWSNNRYNEAGSIKKEGQPGAYISTESTTRRRYNPVS